jgi:hypothetical protein
LVGSNGRFPIVPELCLYTPLWIFVPGSVMNSVYLARPMRVSDTVTR